MFGSNGSWVRFIIIEAGSNGPWVRFIIIVFSIYYAQKLAQMDLGFCLL